MKWSEAQLKWMEENVSVIETGSISEIRKAAMCSSRLNSSAADQIVLALSVLKGSSIELREEEWYSMSSGMAGQPDRFRLCYFIEGKEIRNYKTITQGPSTSSYAYQKFKDYLSFTLNDPELEKKVLRITSCVGFDQ